MNITFFFNREGNYCWTWFFFFQVVNEPADVHLPVAEISTQFKLSCLSWNKCTKNHLASSDYEGIVTLWDMATRQVFRRSILIAVSDIKCYVYYSGYSYTPGVLTSWFCIYKNLEYPECDRVWGTWETSMECWFF